jgi:ABC-type sugar transport system permease subunit
MFEFTLATNLFIAYFLYIFRTYVKLLFNKSERLKHKEKNIELERLRQIAYKTPEQQKEFLDLKYPKKVFDWSFKNVLTVLFQLIIFITLFILFRKFWATYLMFNFKLWQLFLIMLFLPLVINSILKRFNLQQDDIRVYFPKSKK